MAHRIVRTIGPVSQRARGAPQSPSLQNARSILVIRLDGAGDVVLTSAFLRELRRNAPRARITLVVQPSALNLVELCPHVDAIVTFDSTGPRYARTPRNLRRALRLARDEFRDHQFDLAIMPRWDIDSYFGSFLAYLSNATARVTYSEKVFADKAQENRGMDDLFTRVFDERGSRHEVERSLRLIELLGGTVEENNLETWVGRDDESDAAGILHAGDIAMDSSLIALGVGAGQPKRAWPLDRYVVVANQLLELGHSVAIIGGENDRLFGDEIESHTGSGMINLIGRTTLRQTLAVLRRCQLFIGNDAGPMHLAAASGIPVLEISCHPMGGDPMHPNSPARFGPWNVPHVVLQPAEAASPCRRWCEADAAHCIRGISVAEVQAASARLLHSLHLPAL